MAEMKKAIDETESILISSGEPTSANDLFKEIKKQLSTSAYSRDQAGIRGRALSMRRWLAGSAA
jgi:hypothetical protein